jgi:hypothetical protein
MRHPLMNELAGALLRETALVAELHETLLAQRTAVSVQDVSAVQASCDSLARVLLTLREARTLRGRIVAALVGGDECPLESLEATLGCPVSPALEQARAGLRHAVEGVVQQVTVNHTILRRVVESGEAFLNALFASIDEPTASYAAPGERSAESAPAVLLNRTA